MPIKLIVLLEETEYLIKRENIVVGKIKDWYQRSSEVFSSITDNYKEATEVLKLVNEATAFLQEAHLKFEKLLDTFNEANIEWGKNISKRESELSEVEQKIRVDKVLIKNDKEGIENTKKSLLDQQRKIDDERDTLVRNIERFKNNKL